jgi:hypothetical protein
MNRRSVFLDKPVIHRNFKRWLLQQQAIYMHMQAGVG